MFLVVRLMVGIGEGRGVVVRRQEKKVVAENVRHRDRISRDAIREGTPKYSWVRCFGSPATLPPGSSSCCPPAATRGHDSIIDSMKLSPQRIAGTDRVICTPQGGRKSTFRERSDQLLEVASCGR